MKIAVVGTGYVGLVAGACFADVGSDVVCVDVDPEKLRRLEQGHVPFFEPGLESLVRRNYPSRLRFSSDLAASVAGRRVVFVAVGTPPNEDGSADLSHVLAVARDVARVATNDLALVLKSTVPVGTNEKVTAIVRKEGRHQISVVSNPEFLKEGDAVQDFLKPDRIVVGTDDDHAFELLNRLYAPFNRQRNRLVRMGPKSAEIVKYAANALLATRISFMNEIARLCDAAGGDVEDVRIALGADHRLGYHFLYPGLGFGGSCFPKDLRALVRTGDEHGLHLEMARAAIVANEAPVEDLVRDLEGALGSLSGRTIAVWGLAFKPRTDDVREAPALRLIEKVVKKGAVVRATDPQAIDTARVRLREAGIESAVTLLTDPYAACEGADALVIATEWSEFRAPDAERLRKLLRGKHVFDGRNALVPEEIVEAGLVYRGVGRPRRDPS
ncbi:MAG TPA: UDP-glucose/GDP-mannose dehydrogenase family protein [Polyangiaceae bacterium]|nr:UDP-glucose/GDP-mannose dehydrogenase family protein [Polyangiaceae bacterium]